MLPPTASTLDGLSAFDTIDDALAAGADRDLSRPWTPKVEFDGAQYWLLTD
jgi:hypothetical protein